LGAFNSKIKFKNITLVDNPLLKQIWVDRGTPSKNPIFVHPVKWAGKSVTDKIAAIRQKMEEQEATVHIISSLDDVAWTLNLRGSDVQQSSIFRIYYYH
jgi:Xaa-Pro aminopeptidase